MDMLTQRQLIGGLGNLMFKEAYLYSKVRDGVIPDMYLQDEKYFKKYEKEIRERFGANIGFSPYVGVHVRLGDYVGSNFHTDLTETDYYDRAMALFPDKKFLFFSDDRESCHWKFNGLNILISTGESETEDFNMLSSCSSIIMANSSFSWWAAYLCPNPAKRIIAPKEENWFKDGVIRCKLPSYYEQI